MIDGPVTLSTGGGSGIGAATARRLLGAGHRVAVTGRGQERLDRLAEDLGRPAELLTLVGDAADWDAVSSAVETTVARFGRLDAAVANAGYATFDNIADGDPAGWRDMVLTNVLGPALLIRAALPALRQARGRIVLVGSVAGVVYSPGNIYGATKWASASRAESTSTPSRSGPPTPPSDPRRATARAQGRPRHPPAGRRGRGSSSYRVPPWTRSASACVLIAQWTRFTASSLS